jgi:hypothetical protein
LKVVILGIYMLVVMLRVSSLVSGLVAFLCFYGANTAFSPSSGINDRRHAEVILPWMLRLL